MKCIFLHTFDEVVWHLHPDRILKNIIIEARDGKHLCTNFYCISNIQHLKKIQNPLDEKWWMGIELAHHGIMLMYVYDHTQVSDHKGIVAYHYETQKTLWINHALQFCTIQGNIITAKNAEKNYTTGYYDLHTGNPLTDLLPHHSEHYEPLLYPHTCFEGTPEHQAVIQYLDKKHSIGTQNQLHYLEIDDLNLVLIEYQLQNSGYLLVVNKMNTVLYHEKICSYTSGIGNGSFFIFDQKLYLVCDKKTLQVYTF